MQLRRKLDILILASVLLLAAAVAAHFWIGYWHVRAVRAQLVGITDDAVGDIRGELRRIEETAHNLAKQVSIGTLSEEQLSEQLKNVVDPNPSILEAGVAYVRDKGPSGKGLYGPHYGFRDGKKQIFHIEASYNYTETEWFNEAMNQGPGWMEPYFGEATQSWVVGYGIPILPAGADKNGRPIGVVRVNYSMQQIQSQIERLSLGAEGYACIARLDSTRVVYHPIDMYVRDKLTLFDIAERKNDPVLRRMAKEIAQGKPGLAERPATLTGEMAFNIYRPIAGTNWNLVLVFIKDEALGDGQRERIDSIVIVVLLVLALSLIIARILRVESCDPACLWSAVGLVSLLLGGAIGYIWLLSFDPRIFRSVQQGMIYDAAGVQGFESKSQKFFQKRGEAEPIFIPTGVAISSIEFKSAAAVTIKGYVWQKIPSAARHIQAGFELPDATESSISEPHTRPEQGYETRRFSFQATLRQRFDFQRYPLDFQRIRLVLSRADLEHNVVFVPDLDSYPSMIPQTRPGLERSFFVAGWQIEKTFFNHQRTSHNAKFGIDNFVGTAAHPSLVYNVVIRRDFGSPFIANIVPLLLIAGIGFALLSMIHREPDRITAYDARGGRVTGTSAALFFALLLAHIRLRNELVGLRDTIYIEYFYFVMYASCLAIVADALVVASKKPAAWLLYRDNFIPKLLYWPVLLVVLLGITIVFFC